MSYELHANEYPRASSILGGLSLVTQFASTATDSMPIVKLVVGVVAQIVKLADDIEKRRTALHVLANTARTTGESIKAVTAHRQPSEQVEGSLQGLLHVFHAIQVLFARHRAKHPFFKALSYAFTTAGHIDDLTRELSRASQQFTLIAGLDTNARAREAEARLEETNTRLQDAKADIQELRSQMEKNSYYTGQCRNLHDCDVDNLKLIHEETFYRSRYQIRYYTVDINGVTTAHAGAKNNGTVFVLRSIQRIPDFQQVGTTDDDDLLQMISRSDSVLEKLSTPSNRHRNIAHLYGRRMGDHLASFTVMKSGYISLSKVARGSVSIEQKWNLIVQIVDALCHLDERGASWAPDGEEDIFLDDSGAPIIGLNNDLRYVKRTYHIRELGVLGHLLEASLGDREERLRIDADDRLAILPSAMHIPWSGRGGKSRVPLRLVPSFDERRSRYLQKALASCRDEWDTTGMLVLLAAASGRTVGSIFLTQYFAKREGQDGIYMHRAEERDGELIFLETSVDVPVDMKDEVRKALGITLLDPDSYIEIFFSTSDPADLSSLSFKRA